MILRNDLIIVEGLTGAGKSSMAHFIARQLDANQIRHIWVHESEMPHPIFPDEAWEIEVFVQEMPRRWKAFIEENKKAGKIAVVEACFFNNLFEELFIENIDRHKIIEFGMKFEEIIRPFSPALIYLYSGEVVKALKKNIENRGEAFRDFAINFVEKTTYAKRHNLIGYEGMVTFWQNLISIYEELFQAYTVDKLWIDSSTGDWQNYNQAALVFLDLPYVPEPERKKDEATKYLGRYQQMTSEYIWRVWYDDEQGFLRLNNFILLPINDDQFAISSYHFVVHFESNNQGEVVRFGIKGRDINYMRLVGTTGIKIKSDK